MNLSPLKIAYEKYEKEPTAQNRILVDEELEKLRQEFSFKDFSKEQLENELYELKLFYEDTETLPESESKEDQLCRIKRTIRYVNYLLTQMKEGVLNGKY